MRAWTPAALYLILGWALLGRGDGLLRAAEEQAIRVSVKGVAPDPSGNAYMVLLVDPAGQRGLPIWIGLFEAQAIAREIDGEKPERPLTHDLILKILQGLEARIDRVVIDQLKDNTFFAKIELKLHSGERQIDARPSDAIAVALRAKAPIFVAASVMRQAVALNLTQSGLAPTPVEAPFGIQVQPLSGELKRFFGKDLEGVLVAAVAPGSVAAEAGLQRGDVVTALEGQPIKTPGELQERLEQRGKSATKLTVSRSGRELTVALHPPQ
jgi:bifunctional DNase/RNase